MRGTALVVALLLAACGGQDSGESPRDTLTQRQRDSVLGASRLPGARGIQKALEAVDTAAARNRLLDSLRRE